MRKQCVYVSIIIIIMKNVRFSKGYNAIKVFMSLYKKDKATPPAAAWTLWKKAGIGGSNMCTHKPLETKMIPRSPQKPQCWYQKWWRKKLPQLVPAGESDWRTLHSHSLFQTRCQSDAWLHPKFDALASFGSIFIAGEEIYKLTAQCLSETIFLILSSCLLNFYIKMLYPQSCCWSKYQHGLRPNHTALHWEALLADDLVSDHHRQGWRGRCLALEVGCRSFASQSLCRALEEFGITGEKRRAIHRMAASGLLLKHNHRLDQPQLSAPHNCVHSLHQHNVAY